MTPTLYFLRSSEQNIATEMTNVAHRLDSIEKTVKDIKEFEIYNKSYGLTTKDLGLYALVDNKIAGAVWLRLLKEEDNATAFIDESVPILSIAVLPEFRLKGVGSSMLEQLLQEAGSLYKKISVSCLSDESSRKFFKRHGFIQVENSSHKSIVDGADMLTMTKVVSEEKVVRPTDGYDPTRWMD
ncbi:GNAT family N-acetyltransferase [Sulfurimonas sp.]|nr:GNAT family N-acetyltransferase [Sulfurimonas sp.]